MKFNIVLIYYLFFSCIVYGTGQVPDYLIIEKDTLPIFTNPLEQYFENGVERDFVDFVGCGSTACWRGYKAIWKLKGDKLTLVRITSCHPSCGLEIRDANLKEMFGDDEVEANWFSGTIVIPTGKLVQYIHMGYASIYEKERHLKFRKGKIVSDKIKSNDKITQKIYRDREERRLSKLLQDTVFHHIKNNIDWSNEYINLTCDDEYILTFNKKGKIKNVKFAPVGDTAFEDLKFNIGSLRCKKIIKKALKVLDLSYLDVDFTFSMTIEFFYDTETQKLEHWKEYWMENDD